MMKQGSSDRINLQHKNVFEQLLESPSLVQDKDIAGSLEELRSHLATLGLKDKKKEKILDHIDLLIKKDRWKMPGPGSKLSKRRSRI